MLTEREQSTLQFITDYIAKHDTGTMTVEEGTQVLYIGSQVWYLTAVPNH